MTLPVLLGTLAVLSGATLGGFAGVRFLGGDFLHRERLGWSMACGMLLLPAASAGLMAAGLVPGPKKLGAILAVLLAGSFLARRPGRSLPPLRRAEGPSIFSGILFLASIAAVLLFAVEAWRGGAWATDHLAIWGLKAKTIFATASIPQRLFHDPSLAFSHPEYPLLVPLTFSSVAAGLRAWDVHALALLDPFLALATVLVVSGFLARRVSRVAGSAGGLLVALCAPLYAPARVGTAEIAMACGFALAAVAFLDAIDRETPGACARLFLASLFCAATKREGSLWVALLLVALFVRAVRGHRLPRLAALSLGLPLIAHDVGMRLVRGPLADRDFDLSLLTASASDLASRFQLVSLQILGIEAHRAWIPLLLLGVLLLTSRRSLGDPLLLPLALQLAAYAAACVVSAFDPVWQVQSAFSRIALTLFPTVVLISVPRAFESAEPPRAIARERWRGRFPASAAVGLLLLGIVGIPAALQAGLGEKRLGPSVPRPTFHASVQPILQAHCQTCHRPGGIGPFALTSFDDAVLERGAIVREVMTRDMPPWKAGETCGRFANDPSLSKEQIATIVRWVDAGAPEGNPRDAPPPRTFSEGWELGTPDLVLQAPEFTPDFSKGDLYQCFAVPTNLDEDQWVAAVEVKPGNRAMVHHALLYVEEGVRSFDFDEEAPGPGYPCFGGPRAPVTDSFGEWAPGMQPHFYPEGVARFLPRKSRILMQIHYSALSGTIQPDRSEVGVYFAKAPVSRRLLSDNVRAAGPWVIPAGAPNHTLRGRLGPLRSQAELIAILPHMHLLGKTMRVDARLPDGATRCLVDVKDWDLRWQRTYFYEKPVVLPAGTMLDLTATFDNSYANPHNPNQPPRDVYPGEHTTDEMCMALLFWTVDGKNPGEREAFFRGEVCGVGPTRTPTPQ